MPEDKWAAGKVIIEVVSTKEKASGGGWTVKLVLEQNIKCKKEKECWYVLYAVMKQLCVASFEFRIHGHARTLDISARGLDQALLFGRYSYFHIRVPCHYHLMSVEAKRPGCDSGYTLVPIVSPFFIDMAAAQFGCIVA